MPLPISALTDAAPMRRAWNTTFPKARKETALKESWRKQLTELQKIQNKEVDL
jgi:hypothetical protein